MRYPGVKALHGAQIPGAQDVLDLPGHQQLLEVMERLETADLQPDPFERDFGGGNTGVVKDAWSKVDSPSHDRPLAAHRPARADLPTVDCETVHHEPARTTTSPALSL